MTTIRTTCPTCGEVDLQPGDIELHIVRSDTDSVGLGSSYEFACPACDMHVSKPADERIARMLATGGVRVTVGTLTALPRHPESPPAGPPFTLDDVLEFHLLLQRDDWHAQLV